MQAGKVAGRGQQWTPRPYRLQNELLLSRRSPPAPNWNVWPGNFSRWLRAVMPAVQISTTEAPVPISTAA